MKEVEEVEQEEQEEHEEQEEQEEQARFAVGSACTVRPSTLRSGTSADEAEGHAWMV